MALLDKEFSWMPSGTYPSYVPDQYASGMPVNPEVMPKPPVRPLSDISPIQMSSPTPVQAGSQIGETPSDPTRQPGNRKSIKEYLEDIRMLRDQLRAQGIPEDQLPVPTFTNIQGGPLDVEQGRLMDPSQQQPEYQPPANAEALQGRQGHEDFRLAASGSQPPPQAAVDQAGRPVRSFMWGEYKQDPNAPMATPTYGPEHSITRGAAAMGLSPNQEVAMNALDPNYADSVTIQMFDEIREAAREELGREPNPTEFAQFAQKVRMAAMAQQVETIDKIQKTFKNADAADMWEYLQTGDVSKLMKSYDKHNSPEARQNRRAKLAQEWAEIQQKASTELKPYPDNPETGMPYQTGQEYIDQQLRQFDELMGFALQQAQSKGTQYSKQPAAPSAGFEPRDFYNFLRAQGVDPETAKAETMKRYGKAGERKGQ